jgi:hypothetical protein
MGRWAGAALSTNPIPRSIVDHFESKPWPRPVPIPSRCGAVSLFLLLVSA